MKLHSISTSPSQSNSLGRLSTSSTASKGGETMVSREDAGIMHIATLLEANVGNESNDWFEFPGKQKEGSYSKMELNLDSRQLSVKGPVVQKYNGIKSIWSAGKSDNLIQPKQWWRIGK